MTPTEQMPPARRRPVPGMSVALPAPPPPSPTAEPTLTTPEGAGSPAASASQTPETVSAARPTSESPQRGRTSSDCDASTGRPRGHGDADRPRAALQGRRAADYATTRLVNFRIPVDLHDRYRQLVRDAEQQHPRLRHPASPSWSSHCWRKDRKR